MKIKINLKDYPIDKLQLMAKIRLEIIQNSYTIARDDYICDYIENNKKSSGFLWWKTYSDLTRDEAIAEMNKSQFQYAWKIHYSKETASNESTKFLNNILKINEYEIHAELILDNREYNWLMN